MDHKKTISNSFSPTYIQACISKVVLTVEAVEMAETRRSYTATIGLVIHSAGKVSYNTSVIVIILPHNS